VFLSVYPLIEQYPIFFNGVRGGQYRNVTVNCVTGSFIAQGAEFFSGSVVDVTLPMGDVIISANQRIETTLSSIYSATPPSLVPSSIDQKFPLSFVSNSVPMPDDQLQISIEVFNFRNVSAGYSGLGLIVPNGTCKHTLTLPGVGARSTVFFQCSFEIQSDGEVSGPLLLSYFGSPFSQGNLQPTGFVLSFSAYISGNSAHIYSQAFRKLNGNAGSISVERYSGEEECGSAPGTGPQNVCAVAATGTGKVPPFSVATANKDIVMSPANVEVAKQNSFKFFSKASRSLTLGSFLYKDYTGQAHQLESITNCTLEYSEYSDDTQLFYFSRHYHIPYIEQKKLLNVIDALNQNTTEFVIIKTQGSGSNLPGLYPQILNP